MTYYPTTPPAITKHVRQFLAAANLLGKPRYLPFTLISTEYFPGYCLYNCATEARRSGDAAEYGWMIWQHETASFIEAEFHAVIRRKSGIQDITPRRDGEEIILFVPDSTRVPRFEPPNAWHTWSNFKSHEITDDDRKGWIPQTIDVAAVVAWANESAVIAERPDVQYCVEKDDAFWYAADQQQYRGGPQRVVAVDDSYLSAQAP